MRKIAEFVVFSHSASTLSPSFYSTVRQTIEAFWLARACNDGKSVSAEFFIARRSVVSRFFFHLALASSLYQPVKLTTVESMYIFIYLFICILPLLQQSTNETLHRHLLPFHFFPFLVCHSIALWKNCLFDRMSE